MEMLFLDSPLVALYFSIELHTPTGTDLGQFKVSFQSDIDVVPEPGYIGLLTLGMLGMAMAAKRHRSGEA